LKGKNVDLSKAIKLGTHAMYKSKTVKKFEVKRKYDVRFDARDIKSID